MGALEIDPLSARDAACRLRRLSEAVAGSDVAGALALPGNAAAAASWTRLVQAERRCSERAADRLANAARRLEDVASAVLAADRYDGAQG